MEEKEGQKVLRNVFKICKKYLVHIQNSVFEASLDFLQQDPLGVTFKDWFNFKQSTKTPFVNQASVEASFKLLKTYSKNNVVKAVELVTCAIAANAVNLFNIETKPEPVVIPKHHMPR